jgi:hypothetical protein
VTCENLGAFFFLFGAWNLRRPDFLSVNNCLQPPLDEHMACYFEQGSSCVVRPARPVRFLVHSFSAWLLLALTEEATTDFYFPVHKINLDGGSHVACNTTWKMIIFI